jgi:hydrogenase/urease accessory protein HupE
MRGAAATALLALAAALPGAGASAHEIGTLQVTVTFRADGHYQARVLLHSASALAEEYGRLRAAGEPERSQRREGFRRTFVEKTRLVFDGARALPSATLEEAPGAEVTVRLEGSVPTGARAFRWSSDLGYTTYALQLQKEGDRSPTTYWLAVGEESPDYALDGGSGAGGRWRTALVYLHLGFTHIVPKGLDHILFVLGLFLLSVRLRPLLAQVTAFTVAHSITLALTMYGVVSLPPSIVEPAIALSITCVAVENVLTRELKPWRVALVFAFGLLHGMGFAGVLSELGLPRSQFATALVAFNAGVELGQLAVIGCAYALLGAWFKDRDWYRRRVVVPASAAIAAVGACWTVQRMLRA